MEISQTDIDNYWREGFVLLRNMIPPALCEAARTRALAVAEGDNDWGDAPFQCLPVEEFQWPNGAYIPIGIQQPAKRESTFADVASHPNLQKAMSALLRGPVELFTDQIGVKHEFLSAHSGGVSHYHQDSYYWHIPPELGCNCWIPLQDVAPEASALGILPRSHEGWVLEEHEQYYDDPPLCSARSKEPFKRHRIPSDRIDFSQESIVPMSAGDGLFFTNYTWHRAEPNLSGVTKLFYAIAYKRSS